MPCDVPFPFPFSERSQRLARVSNPKVPLIRLSRVWTDDGGQSKAPNDGDSHRAVDWTVLPERMRPLFTKRGDFVGG